VVAILSGLDAEAPSSWGFEVRFTVQDVILARTHRPADALRLSNVHVQPYLTQLTVPTPIGPIANPAGWASVDVPGHGWRLRFVTTHLAFANFDPTVALAQAQELRDTAGNTELPVICVGDFNATASDRKNPTFAIYQAILEAGFVDTWRHTHHKVCVFTRESLPRVCDVIPDDAPMVAEGTSAFVWPDYAMIAYREESRGWLIFHSRQNCSKTPPIVYYQGKKAC
jgi:hypothetical protein